MQAVCSEHVSVLHEASLTSPTSAFQHAHDLHLDFAVKDPELNINYRRISSIAPATVAANTKTVLDTSFQQKGGIPVVRRSSRLVRPGVRK